MEKKTISRIWQRALIIAALAGILFILITTKQGAVPIFFWIIATLMFINFWIYCQKENSTFFFLPLLVMAAMFVIVMLSFIGYLSGTPVFNSFWREIFGWPSVIAIIFIVIYALSLLDKEIRNGVKKYCYRNWQEISGIVILCIVLIWMYSTLLRIFPL
jgi:hypothetical protein